MSKTINGKSAVTSFAMRGGVTVWRTMQTALL